MNEAADPRALFEGAYRRSVASARDIPADCRRPAWMGLPWRADGPEIRHCGWRIEERHGVIVGRTPQGERVSLADVPDGVLGCFGADVARVLRWCDDRRAGVARHDATIARDHARWAQELRGRAQDGQR